MGLWNNAYLELLILVLIHKTPAMGNTNLATLNSVKDNNMMGHRASNRVSPLNVYTNLRLDVFGTYVELLCTCELVRRTNLQTFTNASQPALDKRNKTMKRFCLTNKNPCLEQVHKNLWIVQNGDSWCNSDISEAFAFFFH